MISTLLPYMFDRPSVYVISDSQLAKFKREQTEREIAELNKLIDDHKEAITRLEKTRDLLQAETPE